LINLVELLQNIIRGLLDFGSWIIQPLMWIVIVCLFIENHRLKNKIKEQKHDKT
jgi:uncharacterized membrane protein